eukprot:gene20656-22697_t
MSQLQAVSIKPVAEFRPDAEVGASLATRWKDWLDDFEMFLLASGITDKTRKRALLLYQAGPRVREIFKNLTEVGGTSDFDVAKNKLTEYFEPQKNRRYEVYRFRQATQEQTETLDQFHTRLRTMAQTCEFHDAEFEIEEQIIIGVCPAKSKECKICKKQGHFASVCRDKNTGNKFRSPRKPQRKSTTVHSLANRSAGNLSSSEDDYLYAVSNKGNSQSPKVAVTVCNTAFQMTLDTGATINVIDKDTFSRMKDELEEEHLSPVGGKEINFVKEVNKSPKNVASRIREIVTKSISPPLPIMARESSLADENRLLQAELAKVEDMLASTRAERDEIGSKFSALSEKVGEGSFSKLKMSATAMDDSMKSLNGSDSRQNESLVQTNSLLRQKLEEEHVNYKRKLQAYQDGQQRQAQLIQKLQSKVCMTISVFELNGPYQARCM